MTPDIKPILEKLADLIHLTTLSCMGSPNAYRDYQIARAKFINETLLNINEYQQQPKPTASSHQDKDGNPVWEKTKIKLPEKFRSNDIAPGLDQVVSILNALIDVVRESIK